MNEVVSFIQVTDLTGAIVVSFFALVMVALITVGAVLLGKAIQQQNKYNNTALPRIIPDSESVDSKFDDLEEEETVFDLDSGVEDEYEDEGYESDKWFAQARGIDEEEMEDIRRRRGSVSSRQIIEEEDDEDWLDAEDEVVEHKPKGLPEQPRGRSASLPKL